MWCESGLVPEIRISVYSSDGVVLSSCSEQTQCSAVDSVVAVAVCQGKYDGTVAR